jgi:hypothetical protein
MPDVFIFYADILKISQLNEIKLTNFEEKTNGWLKTFIFYDSLENAQVRTDFIDMIIEKEFNDDVDNFFQELAQSNNIKIEKDEFLLGKFFPLNLSKIIESADANKFKKIDFDKFSKMYKKRFGNNFLILAQQYSPKGESKGLTITQGQNVVAAIINWFLNIHGTSGSANVEYNFYLISHDKHLGRKNQSSYNYFFKNDELLEFAEDIKKMTPGFDNKYTIAQVVSFKHEFAGFTYKILSEIDAFTSILDIKKKFAFTRRELHKLLESLLPTAIDCSRLLSINKKDGIKELEKEFFSSISLKSHLNTIKSDLDKIFEEEKDQEDIDESEKQRLKEICEKIINCEKGSDFLKWYNDFSETIKNI